MFMLCVMHTFEIHCVYVVRGSIKKRWDKNVSSTYIFFTFSPMFVVFCMFYIFNQRQRIKLKVCCFFETHYWICELSFF